MSSEPHTAETAYIRTADAVIDLETCARYIAEAEQQIWYASSASQIQSRGSAKNSRMKAFVDVDLDALFLASKDAIPARLLGMQAVGLAREQLMVLRYREGNEFSLHTDGPFQASDGARTLLTFVLYLNDDFVGGETYFPRIPATVSPRPGRILVFSHSEPHGSAEIKRGTKYILRSAVLYRPA